MTRHAGAAAGPNPLSPHLLTPAERRAELCGLLALGLLRLRAGALDKSVAQSGFALGSAARPSGHAPPPTRRPA